MQVCFRSQIKNLNEIVKALQMDCAQTGHVHAALDFLEVIVQLTGHPCTMVINYRSQFFLDLLQSSL
jgi:hypothetical protein